MSFSSSIARVHSNSSSLLTGTMRPASVLALLTSTMLLAACSGEAGTPNRGASEAPLTDPTMATSSSTPGGVTEQTDKTTDLGAAPTEDTTAGSTAANTDAAQTEEIAEDSSTVETQTVSDTLDNVVANPSTGDDETAIGGSVEQTSADVPDNSENNAAVAMLPVSADDDETDSDVSQESEQQPSFAFEDDSSNDATAELSSDADEGADPEDDTGEGAPSLENAADLLASSDDEECVEYCTILGDWCTERYEQYDDSNACMTRCDEMEHDGGSFSGDTIACRLWHVTSNVQEEREPSAEEGNLHCSHAGPDSAGLCTDD